MSQKFTVVPGKAPFHAGLFFLAVTHLLGKPDHKHDGGFDGFYDYFWECSDKKRQKEIGDKLCNIQEMMKCFDLKFPESRCDVAKWPSAIDPNMEYLRITIVHEVEKEGE